MAKSLVWRDLSADQLENLRHPHPKKGLTARDLLAKFLGITDKTSAKNAIDLDLYVHTLQFGQELQLADDKLSGLLSIVVEVHRASTQGRMTLDRSFSYFKDLLLMHSIQRPPYSIGLLTLPEMKQILHWFLGSYYRHYKLYQYTFTDRVMLSGTQIHPLDVIEVVTEPIPPLIDAMTEEQHNAILSEQQRAREEEEAAAAAAAAAQQEEQVLQQLKEEYEAAIPDEIKERVQAAVDKELALLRAAMEQQFQAQQQELAAKIAQLETKTA